MDNISLKLHYAHLVNSGIPEGRKKKVKLALDELSAGETLTKFCQVSWATFENSVHIASAQDPFLLCETVQVYRQ